MRFSTVLENTRGAVLKIRLPEFHSWVGAVWLTVGRKYHQPVSLKRAAPFAFTRTETVKPREPPVIAPWTTKGFFPRIWVESVYNSTQALWPPQWWQLKLIQFIWQCYIAKNVFIFLSTITVTLLCEDLVLTTRHSRSSDTTNISGDGFSMIEDGGKSRKATFIHRVKI